MHDAASVLARLAVRPGKLVGDTIAVGTQPDVVDPTKTIKVFRANRPGHGDPRCYQPVTWSRRGRFRLRNRIVSR